MSSTPALPPPPGDSKSLAAGTILDLKLHEVVDSDQRPATDYIPAEVADDIRGSDGRLAFPAGSHALIVFREAAKEKTVSTLTLALFSVFNGTRQVRFADGAKDLATVVFTENSAGNSLRRPVHLGEDTILHFRLQTALSLQ